MMRPITAVRVYYADGTEEFFEGKGTAGITNTLIEADKDSGTPRQDVRYLTLSLDLPIPVKAQNPASADD